MNTTLATAVQQALKQPRRSTKPLAIVLAGHNGSGKSTMWYEHIADQLRIPLVNADRMMLSILPEANRDGKLKAWAQDLRDTNELWMGVAQRGVFAFIGQAMASRAAFATETVFSHWKQLPDGTFESKINMIVDMQSKGYYVLLLFVGLSNANLSIGRVQMRKQMGGHDVNVGKLVERFPRTQQAVSQAINVADAAILVDNSRTPNLAFTPVHTRKRGRILYDIRHATARPAKEIREWLDVIVPLT